MKKLTYFAAISSLALLTACSSSPKKDTSKAKAPECVFPNTTAVAPGWVCDEPVPGLEVTAVGVAVATKAGISYQKDMAALDARGRLAEQMKVRVNKMVKSYVGTTGGSETETLDAAASSTAKSITSQDLVGSKIYKSRTAPDGTLFVLVGVDSINAEKIAKHAVRTSMNNDNALWQQFKAKQSFDEMAEGIAQQDVN